ncbi:MAG: hypothetical protein GXY99_04745 [Clostridiaceae bacterium]|nr:hypothetical protein [Clostridiaceae bacterium]
MNNYTKTNGKPDSNHNFSTTKSYLHNHNIVKEEAETRQQIIEFSSKQIDYLAWDLGVLEHNLSSLDPVLNLLCFDLKTADKDQLKALIYCARDTLENTMSELSDDVQSALKRFNNLFPEVSYK